VHPQLLIINLFSTMFRFVYPFILQLLRIRFQMVPTNLLIVYIVGRYCLMASFCYCPPKKK